MFFSLFEPVSTGPEKQKGQEFQSAEINCG